MKFQRPFAEHRVVNLDQSDEVTMTHQSFRDECDINAIVARFEKTGLIEHVNKVQGHYGDFIAPDTYQMSMNAIIDANAMFSQLPSVLRKRFENDPVQFLDFAQNPDNRDEMIKFGLIEERTDSLHKTQNQGVSDGGSEPS